MPPKSGPLRCPRTAPQRYAAHVISSIAVFAGLAIVAAASAAAATLNFEGLDGSGNQAVPNGYGGLNWTNFYVYDAVNDPGNLSHSGYEVAWVSQNNVAFSAFPTERPTETISSDTLFNLNSAYLTSVWRDNLQVRVIGSLAGVPVPTYDNTYTLSATAHTLETFNYVGIDSVEFIPSGGTFHDGYKFDAGPYFAMDDVNIDLVQLFAVPEPGTWLAAALALGVIGFSQRKRVRARARFIKGCASRTVSNT